MNNYGNGLIWQQQLPIVYNPTNVYRIHRFTYLKLEIEEMKNWLNIIQQCFLHSLSCVCKLSSLKMTDNLRANVPSYNMHSYTCNRISILIWVLSKSCCTVYVELVLYCSKTAIWNVDALIQRIQSKCSNYW